MIQPWQTPRRLEQRHLAEHVGRDIGIGIDQRMPDPGLCREMHDPGDARLGCEQGAERLALGDVQGLVVRVEIVDAHHPFAARPQAARYMRPDEARAAGHQNRHRAPFLPRVAGSCAAQASGASGAQRSLHRAR